ncbi:MAG: [FeFe] hydrogenase H-cluster maturation GTPase HydF [Calditrichia bacterium]
MKSTPRSNRIHIGIFGRRNAGKSQLVNAVTGQDIALVSDVPGTTTDPVYKSIEILPLGPCVMIDTAGLDDVGSLGALRVKKTREVLDKTDLALLVVSAETGWSDFERQLIYEINLLKIPYLVVLNKIDKGGYRPVLAQIESEQQPVLKVSAVTGQGIHELKEKFIEMEPGDWQQASIVGDLVGPQDTVVMVIPIDDAMPKNRLILPEVQVLRELLDNNCHVLVTKDMDLPQALEKLTAPPTLVISDSQVFQSVSLMVPEEIPLTSFSILFARYKGDIEAFLEGVKAVNDLEPGDRVLIAEACTHHAQKEDIGRVKIPHWLNERAGGELQYDVHAGGTFPEDLSRYKLIVHCGACMINRRQTLRHVFRARTAQVPITNYGILIAYLKGILPRVVAPLGLSAVPDPSISL